MPRDTLGLLTGKGKSFSVGVGTDEIERGGACGIFLVQCMDRGAGIRRWLYIVATTKQMTKVHLLLNGERVQAGINWSSSASPTLGITRYDVGTPSASSSLNKRGAIKRHLRNRASVLVYR